MPWKPVGEIQCRRPDGKIDFPNSVSEFPNSPITKIASNSIRIVGLLALLGRDAMQTQPQNLSEGFLRLPQVLAVYPVSKSAWWAGSKSGALPQAR